ncbi:S-adenosyl-l-methionine hydroxide adenosyltransferase family protein [Emticicia sp. TH156]|uniref:SAM hydrolase/SAM-dependent halogenase family protein n=1 Tax=Emticicia sp. TH156 TaxID=2067454 RepID=UPI000C773288|nr:S-adenosyl-l-methionine hydroxide adenosyltransferase family protein [Emticicia sp. TH156]PLK43708.1 DNA-directed RNA polymerase subunit delta [Emticicia sp. TH156]
MLRKIFLTILFFFLIALAGVIYVFRYRSESALVLMTDFGTKDGAVAAMKGVALQQSGKLVIHDLTHDIPAFNIWEGAYRLQQTAPYWEEGTVFVCVVDPGVGTDRKSIVLKTKANHYYVGPDNGLFTLVAEREGVDEVREISSANRLPDSQGSYTFHGRDVFAFTGAKLAADMIDLDGVGASVPGNQLVRLAYPRPAFKNKVLSGGIAILDIKYGNLWTNIDEKTFKLLGAKEGDSLQVKIYENDRLAYQGQVLFGHTFGDVKEGENILYLNSLMNLSLGINMGNFANTYKIGSGTDWRIEVSR